MKASVIGVWLLIALIGIVLYMIPAFLKEAFVLKENFQTSLKEHMDSWKFVGAEGAPESFVDIPKTASAPMVPQVPDYLQNVPQEYGSVEGVGGEAVTKSQPAPVVQQEAKDSPMLKQGQQAMRTVKAPVTLSSQEGFYAGPSPVASYYDDEEPECGLEYDPNGNPKTVCKKDGNVIFTGYNTTSNTIPTWLKTTTTKDGINTEEASIMNWWLSQDSSKKQPDWVNNLLSKDTLTASEKKAFSTWAFDNTPTSAKGVVKPTSSSLTKDIDTSSSSVSSSSSSSSSSDGCKPKKPVCKPKKTACEKKEEETKTCKGPVQMGDYIRKDSIPCWGCKL